MRGELDTYYVTKEEPVKSCLLALRKIILESDPDMTEAWRYKMPFFYFRKKMFCYLWVNKKSGLPYLGVVDGRKVSHPKLIMEKRSRMKIMTIDPEKDLPLGAIKTILKMSRKLKTESGKLKA